MAPGADGVPRWATIGRIPHRCAISTAARLVAGCGKRVGRWRRGERQSPPRRDHLPEGLLRERSIAQLLRRDTYIIAGPGGHGIGVAAETRREPTSARFPPTVPTRRRRARLRGGIPRLY